MTRNDYLQRVISIYLDAPDTPKKARPADWAVAGLFHKQRVPLDLVDHAVALASLRRRLRPADREPLEPIRSLAYLRPIINQLRQTGVDDNYRQYVAARYASLKA